MSSSAGDKRAGFVLAGGRSSRMGRDKALLPLDGRTLVEHVAAMVQRAAGNVTIIAPMDRYESLGYRVIADRIANQGPLGGVYTALSATNATWNLIVACDMPGLTIDFLEDLFRAAEASADDCVIPQTAAGLDPLCAVYHRRCAAAAISSINLKILKMHDFVTTLQVLPYPVSNAAALENVNTPGQWSAR
jgi:molybdenum cofactor guanylyltransferase